MSYESIDNALNREIEIVEDDFASGRISLQERNARISGLEREARQYLQEERDNF